MIQPRKAETNESQGVDRLVTLEQRSIGRQKADVIERWGMERSFRTLEVLNVNVVQPCQAQIFLEPTAWHPNIFVPPLAIFRRLFKSKTIDFIRSKLKAGVSND